MEQLVGEVLKRGPLADWPVRENLRLSHGCLPASERLTQAALGT
jgi:hypothetical protein